MLHLGQGKNERVAPLEQEVLLEQQKGVGVSLLEQEHLVPQRASCRNTAHVHRRSGG